MMVYRLKKSFLRYADTQIMSRSVTWPIMTSSWPVFPPCGTTARFCSFAYLKRNTTGCMDIDLQNAGRNGASQPWSIHQYQSGKPYDMTPQLAQSSTRRARSCNGKEFTPTNHRTACRVKSINLWPSYKHFQKSSCWIILLAMDGTGSKPW